MSPRVAWLASLFLMLAGWIGSAQADPASEVSYFDDRARRDYKTSRYPEALESFLLAGEVAPSARALYNIAVCAELARDPALAFAYYDAYLAGTDDDSSRRADAEKRAARLATMLAIVRVESDPPGAHITVDRAELGVFGTTPKSIVVSPGDHDIVLSMDDHATARHAVHARVGAVVPIRASLRRREGTLQVTAVPAHARVQVWEPHLRLTATLDDRPISLPVGNYQVRALADGYETAHAEVPVRAGRPSHIALVAKPIPTPVGALLVNTGPVAARVFVDERPFALTPARIDKLRAGTHSVSVRADGYRPWAARIAVVEGQVRYLNVTLRRED